MRDAIMALIVQQSARVCKHGCAAQGEFNVFRNEIHESYSISTCAGREWPGGHFLSLLRQRK